MKHYEYTISKNDLYLAVKAINRLPDAYDKQQNGYYKNLTDAELKALQSKGIIRN